MGTIAELIASLRSTLPHSQSPLPWTAILECGDVSASNNCGVAADIEQENAVYITAAANAVGPLIDEVERLRAENEELRERFRWIPVAEGMPSSCVQVLVYNRHVFVGMYQTDIGRWETYEGEEQISNVTHWRYIDRPLNLLIRTADPSTTPPEPTDA
jgi:hypothetical protein